MNAHYFGGIIRLDETDFAVALRDFSASTAQTMRLHLTGGLQTEDLKTPPEDFQQFLTFLEDTIPAGSDLRICAEFEGVVQPRSSPFSKFCILLAASGFGALGFGTIPEGFTVNRIPEEIKEKQKIDKEIWVLPENTGRAWHEFNRGGRTSAAQAASAVADIASRRYLYYFLSSHGTVQSSVDLIQFLRHADVRKTDSVISAEEMYLLVPTEATRRDIDHVSLEYALARKDFGYLHEIQALKFAVLHVCREYNVRLYCLSFRDGGESIKASGFIEGETPLKEEYLVWPAPTTPPSDLGLDYEL